MSTQKKIQRIEEIWKPLCELVGLLTTAASVITFAYTLAPFIAQQADIPGLGALPYILVLPPFIACLGIPLYATISMLEYLSERARTLKGSN